MEHEPAPNKEYKSPRWSNNTKLVVALSFVAIVAGIFIRFRNFVGPLLFAFILSYLTYPIIEKLHLHLKLPWRLATLLVYLVVVLILIGLLIWGGIAVIEQVQSLILFIQRLITDLPAFINRMSHQVIMIGPFELSLQYLELKDVINQLISNIQPAVTQIGIFVGNFASGAVSGIGWLFFIIMISFFVVAETGGKAGQLINIEIPGYGEDIRRLSIQLSRIWNAFLRNQLVLILLTIVFYTFMLGMLHLRFYFGLAILAGLARFVPYVGPAVAWTTYGLVSLFQGYTILGLTPFWYTVLVIGLAMIVDSLIDNIVSPSLMADALKVHPAAVMVAALVAASLFGIAGVLMAAPVLASAKLFFDYAFDKLIDQDPWRNFDNPDKKPERTGILTRLKNGFARLRIRFLDLAHKIKIIESVRKRDG